jgi:F-type H+-transporting ATPase subunit delta
MADNITVARPYARAVFELAHAAGTLGTWSESLTIAGQLLADKALVEYLGNPEFSDEQRLERRRERVLLPAKTNTARIS